MDRSDLNRMMECAVDEIERCMGWRNAGIAISGMGTPSFRHILTHEDPVRLTYRVMIAPALDILGYGEIRGPYPDRPSEAYGSMVVSSGMNRPPNEGRLFNVLHSEGCPKGIATDGFH